MAQKIKDLLIDGQTESAISALLALTEGTQLHSEVIQQSNRFKSFQREARSGLLAFEEKKLQENRIVDALLKITNQFENGLISQEESPISLAKPDFKPTFDWKKIAVAIPSVLFILAAIAELSGYSIRDLFTASPAGSFTQTVVVHGPDGKDDRILQQQGEVTMTIGGDLRKENINELGEATFKELPGEYRDQTALISVEHPQPYKPVNRDQSYSLTKNEIIFLEVRLTGTEKVFGRVLDAQSESPLDSVRVSFQELKTYTDDSGWFTLDIPEDRQQKFVRLTFLKPGYTMEVLDSIAPHLKQEIGLLIYQK